MLLGDTHYMSFWKVTPFLYTAFLEDGIYWNEPAFWEELLDYCNVDRLISTQQHEAPKNFKLFTILQRKYARYFYPYLLNKNALQNQKSL